MNRIHRSVGILVLLLGVVSQAPAQVDLSYQFSNFYREKNYELAPELLEEFFARFPTIDQDYYWPTSFFFSRIFRTQEAYDKLPSLYSTASKAHKAYLIDIVYLNANAQTKRLLASFLAAESDPVLKTKAQKILDHDDFVYDPLLEEITTSNQLDLLWTVFLTSGEVAAVDKIAAVLDWPDLFRQRLTDFQGSASEKAEAIELLMKFGVQFNGQVVSDISDVDIRTIQSLQQGKLAQEFRRLREILKISDPEVYKMAIKGTAFWALRSNSQQHELVYEECKKLAGETPRGNIMLKIVVASVKK